MRRTACTYVPGRTEIPRRARTRGSARRHCQPAPGIAASKGLRTSRASPVFFRIAFARASGCGFHVSEDAIGFGAPVGTARELLRASASENALVGEIRDPCLALGGAL